MINIKHKELPVITFILTDMHHSLRVFREVKDEASTLKMKGYVKLKNDAHSRVC